MDNRENKRRILVVDDEPDVRNTVALLLQHLGFDCEVAGTAGEAIAALEDRPFDLIFTDILMPGGTGELIAAHLEVKRPGAKILFMSGSVPIGLEARLRLRFGENFLRKPFSLAEVREILLKYFPGLQFPGPSKKPAPSADS